MVQALQKKVQTLKGGGGGSSAEAILEAAELLMSRRGYDGVSLREIAKEAGASLSSVTYFFRTKENLLAAIYERHTKPMNARRLELLREAERISDLDERLPAIVRAHVLPAFTSQSASGGGAQFTRLRGIMSMTGGEAAQRIIASSFDEISRAFIDAVARALPKADRASIVWRGHFLLGSLYYTLVTPERIDRLTGVAGAGSDHERAIDELVDATVASLKALSPEAV